MTDTRLRGEWLNSIRFDDLTDTAWRVFTAGLMWSNENGTDGLIPTRYLRMLHPDGVKPAAYDEITVAGLWTSVEAGFQFVDWDGALGQSTRAYVELHKEGVRRRQREKRERDRSKLARDLGFADAPVTRDVTSDVTGDVGIGTGTGSGEGLTAPAISKTEVDSGEWVEQDDGSWLDSRSGEVASGESGGEVREWPVVPIGQGRRSS